MSYSVSVSLVINFDTNEEVTNIIDKLKQSQVENEIVVLDNGKNYRNYLENDKRVTYIFNKKHIGYANAHNQSFKYLKKKHKYHLFSNVDIDIDYSDDNDVLLKLYNFMETSPECGIAGPKILNLDGEVYSSCKLLPTPFDILIGKFNFSSSKYKLDFKEIKKNTHIPFISGCFLFCKYDSLFEIGFMDKNFFLFMDDVDLCRRMGEKYKIFYCQSTSVLHVHGRFHTRNFYLNYVAMKSIIYYFNKHGWFFDENRKKTNDNLINNQRKNLN